MSNHENLNEKFLVVGFLGDVLSSETTDSLVVRADTLEAALKKSSSQPGFTPVSGMRESELRTMVAKLDQFKN